MQITIIYVVYDHITPLQIKAKGSKGKESTADSGHSIKVVHSNRGGNILYPRGKFRTSPEQEAA